MPKAKDNATYELEWTYADRVATEHLGSRKYSTSSKALRELVANALEADASTVRVELHQNDLGGLESVIVLDNGHGITPKVLRERFVVVGVGPSAKVSPRLSQFGVGRLAVHRIGRTSRWVSVSDSEGARVRLSFVLQTEEPSKLEVLEEVVDKDTPCGTRIEVLNIRDTDTHDLSAGSISKELLSHFCSYLLAHPNRKILVQGEPLEVDQLVAERETEEIPPSENVPEPATLNHLILTRRVDHARFAANVVFAANGRTVHSIDYDDIPSPYYLGIVECPHLDSIVTSNREMVVEMDPGFAELRDASLERIQVFGQHLRSQQSRAFIETARKQEFYPYRLPSSDPVNGMKQAVYDVALERVNEAVNIEGMTKRQQATMFRLLRRSLDNENLLDVLGEVIKLSDEDIERFKKLLERTTLDSIIKLSSEVTHRLDFLDVLHQLVYGDVAKHVKERTQLHKILEPECWLFGSQFHLAASDQSFRAVIQKHRQKAGLDVVSEADLAAISGVRDIPDLFLAATRDYPIDPKHHHVLVELKAPSVSLGKAEVDQVRRYAETILESAEFDKVSTRWDIFLVSGKATRQIERDRHQKDRPHGHLYEWDNMTVWAFEWSEVIARAREEMQLVREHLRRKSEELSVSDYLRENFPDILEDLAVRIEDKAASDSSTSRGHAVAEG